MTTEEFDTALSDLETRVDRLRALYENWFRGYEKTEPAVARKEVERRVYALRKELPRNTALRFRYHQLYQRYTTLASYWQRTARQIEDGTHKLQLQRLRRRNQRGEQRPGNGEEREKRDETGPRSYELDLDESLNVDDLLDDMELDEVAKAIDVPGPHSEPPLAPSTRQFARPAPVARSFGRVKREESLPSLPPVALDDANLPPFAQRKQPDPGWGSSEFPEPPTMARNVPAAMVPPSGTRRELPFPPGVPGARPAAAAPVPGVTVSGARPAAAAPVPGVTGPGARPAAPAPAKASPIMPGAGAGRPGVPGPAGSSPTPAAGRAAPVAGTAPVPARPSPTSPGARPASTVVAGGVPPAVRAPGAEPSPAGQRPAPHAPAPVHAAAVPQQRTIAGIGAPAPQRPAQTAGGAPRPAAPSNPQAPAARAAPTAAARPVPNVSGDTIVGRPPLSSPLASPAAPNEQRLKRIYDEYTAARRRNNEGEIRYEAMVSSIQKMLPELSKRHQGKPIDFEVVVKDGRVGLKPKAT